MGISLVVLVAVVLALGVGVGVGIGVGLALSRRRPDALPGGADPAALPATLGPGALPSPPLIRDLRTGGLVRLSGFGDEFEDVQLEIERYTRVTRGREEWHELAGTYRTRQVGIEWELERNDLLVWAFKRLRGEKLADVGLDPAALESWKPGSTVQAAGEEWVVAGLGRALGHENGIGFGKEHLTWELRCADKTRILRIERWGDEPHAVSRGERIDPGTITIYRAKA